LKGPSQSEKKTSYGSGYGRSATVENMVIDSEGCVYSISNNIVILNFTAAELLLNLKVGGTFKVRGHGLRIPMLGMYHNITRIYQA
jgi:hypothetical protein